MRTHLVLALATLTLAAAPASGQPISPYFPRPQDFSAPAASPPVTPSAPRSAAPTPAETLTAPVAPTPSTAPLPPAPGATSPVSTTAPPTLDASSAGLDFGDEPVSLSYASVGYIDSAAILPQVRLRYDSAYGSNRPNRAEFFYARGGVNAPGLESPERELNYMEASVLVEVPLARRFSLFLDTPIHWLDPQLNRNTAGISDLRAGFKLGLIQEPDALLTFQLLTFAATGDPAKGLGTGHASVMPGLLGAVRPTESLTLFGEAHYWTSINGTDFAGELVRYGVGAGYGQASLDSPWAMPLLELVGWTVLSGKESAFVAPGVANVTDAAGASILNLKLGVRFGTGGCWDAYVGYGRALTGEVWYTDIVRAEWRMRF